MSKLVVIGGVNMDVHLFGPPTHDHDGDTKLVDHYLTQPGGKAANAAGVLLLALAMLVGALN